MRPFINFQNCSYWFDSVLYLYMLLLFFFKLSPPEDKQLKEQGLFKFFLGKEGAYGVLLQTLTKLEENPDVVKDSLKALISLMCKQPDLLDDRGVEVIIQFLDKQKDPEILRLVLKWTKECCIMHEVNRYAHHVGVVSQN